MAFFTYLITADEQYPGKTIQFLADGSIKKIDASKNSQVYAERLEFNDFREMCAALYHVYEDRRGFLVRGEVSPDYIGNKRMFRRKLGKMGSEYVLWRHNPLWICLDIDGMPRPDDPELDSAKNPEAVIAYVLSTLPSYFKDVSCWWQFSSTESLPENRGMIKCHLFFMIQQSMDEKKLKDWLHSLKEKHYFDPAVAGCNQPIYVAPPKIEGKDWLPIRCGVYQGDHDILDLSLAIMQPKFGKKSNVTPIDQSKILSKYLYGKLGDGPGRNGFNDPIKSALGAVIQKCGPDIDRDALKSEIRKIINDAPADPNRPYPKEKYLSDIYLDPLIEALCYRESEHNKATYNEYEIARERYIYIANLHRFYDTISGNYLTKDALNMVLAKIQRSLADHFVTDEEFQIVDTITYFPGQPKICMEKSIETGNITRCFNLYNPVTVEDMPSSEAEFFIEHVRKLAGDEQVFIHIMNWLAHNVQKPGVKIMYALMIQGKQGTGKSALMEAMKMCLGSQNVRAVETHEILGNFNSWMKGKCMTVVEEIRDTTDRFGIYNRLKPLITAPTITLNEKNVAQTPMNNRMNLMMFTQYETAVPMDDDDRRLLIHFSPMEPESEEYYNMLFNLIYKKPGAIRRALLEWDLTDFNPNARAPMTESKQFLREFAGPPVTRMLREALENKDWPLKYDLVVIKDLAEVMPPKFKASDTTLTVALRGLGTKSLGIHRVNGKMQMVWCIRNFKEWEFKDDIALDNHYKKPIFDVMNKIEGYAGEDLLNKKNVPTF